MRRYVPIFRPFSNLFSGNDFIWQIQHRLTFCFLHPKKVVSVLSTQGTLSVTSIAARRNTNTARAARPCPSVPIAKTSMPNKQQKIKQEAGVSPLPFHRFPEFLHRASFGPAWVALPLSQWLIWKWGPREKECGCSQLPPYFWESVPWAAKVISNLLRRCEGRFQRSPLFHLTAAAKGHRGIILRNYTSFGQRSFASFADAQYPKLQPEFER